MKKIWSKVEKIQNCGIVVVWQNANSIEKPHAHFANNNGIFKKFQNIGNIFAGSSWFEQQIFPC